MKRWDIELASIIDHTNLKADARRTEIEHLCEDVRRYRFAAAVVHPFFVPEALRVLKDSGIAVCSVVSFPFGAHPPRHKEQECIALIEAGAAEIDMVMNIGAFLSGEHGVVREELERAVSVCRGRTVTKLIIETALLDRDGIVRAAGMGAAAGFDYIKTSTGHASRGASVEDVELIASAVGGRCGIKAAGGIKARRTALALVEAGATRIGCSASLDVIRL